MGIQLKKVHNILLYDAGQFYFKKRWPPNKNLWNLFREQLKGRPIDWYHFWPLLFFVRQSLYHPSSSFIRSGMLTSHLLMYFHPFMYISHFGMGCCIPLTSHFNVVFYIFKNGWVCGGGGIHKYIPNIVKSYRQMSATNIPFHLHPIWGLKIPQ